MKKKISIGIPSPIRVLVAAGARCNSTSLAEMLRAISGLEVDGPADSVSTAITMGAACRPHVVLLDFHGLQVPVGYAVTLLKELSPQPLVFVLTHDASEAMRRRLREAGVDAVFDKTSDLDALVFRIAALSPKLDARDEPQNTFGHGELAS